MEKIKKIGKILHWYQAMMLGNGTLGVLAYGSDNLILSLDLIDLWDERPMKELLEEDFTYRNMCRLMRTDWKEYMRVFDECYANPFPSKINAGYLKFQRSILPNDRWSVNLNSATLSISSKNGNISGYVDANSPVAVFKMPIGEEYSFELPSYLRQKENQKGLGYPKPLMGQCDGFKWIFQQTKTNLCYAIVMLEKAKNKRKTVYLTIIKGQSKEIINKAKRLLLSYSHRERKKHQDHLHYWKKYYGKSSVVIPDKKMQDLYNKSRYFFACNSHGKYPMPLQGVWTRNDGNLPPWHGDYHSDINLEMSYESYLKNGNFEEGRILLDYLYRNRKVWKNYAKEFANSKGYLIPGVMSLNGLPLGGWPMYALNPNCSIWLLKAFDEYYRYSDDLFFLKKEAYPLFIGLEDCISNLLSVDQDGYLSYGWSSSPEWNDAKESSIIPQSNWELSLLHYLYKTLIRFSKILNEDSRYYERQLARLRPFIRNKKGEMMICDGISYDLSHRHFSHLLMEKNLEILDSFKDRRQIEKDILCLEKNGTSEWVGFSFTEMSQLCSYVFDGEKAYKYARIFEDGFVEENGFHMNQDFKHKGYSKISSDAFTLEANVGFIRSINDMCLFSSHGVIGIFPAIPKIWAKEGVSFSLKAEGGTEVQASYIYNKLSFRIRVRKPRVVRLLNNICQEIVFIVDGEKAEYNSKIGDIIEIDCLNSIEYQSS